MFLTCQSIKKSYGAQVFFDNLSFSVEAGDRIALIGPNGSGKSTFLRILLNEEDIEEGTIFRKNDLRIAYIPQSFSPDPKKSVLDIVSKAASQVSLASGEPQHKASEVLSRCGFSSVDVVAGTLSGGWLKRLAIACGLVQEPDLLLLDEPTNHLDFAGMAWLEELLGSASFAWILVSHDRFFLNETVQKVAELNPIYPEGIFLVEGDYDRFLKKKEDFLSAQLSYKDSLANKVRQENEWLSRGPKARTTKARYRIDQAHSLQQELAVVERRLRQKNTKIEFSESGRKTKKLVRLKKVSKTLGNTALFSELELTLSPGSRFGILGGNGSGKTTLLRLIAKELEADEGSVLYAPDLKLVYFDQHRDQLNPERTLKDSLAEEGDSVIYRGRPYHVVSWAERFGLSAQQLATPVGALSGGEQARTLIARLMLMPADVLLLDEPTNDLDIATRETLEESLLDFPGALVLVTHDRYMLKQVCGSFIGLDGKGAAKSYGSYTQWLKELRAKRTPNKGQETAEKKKASRAPTKAKLSYLEQRELDMMEENIFKAEAHLEVAKKAMEDPSLQKEGEKLSEACHSLDTAQQEVDRLYQRWEELEEKIQDLENENN